jgi:hypothetical protein
MLQAYHALLFLLLASCIVAAGIAATMTSAAVICASAELSNGQFQGQAGTQALSPFQRKEAGRRYLEQSKLAGRSQQGASKLGTAASTTAPSAVSDNSGVLVSHPAQSGALPFVPCRQT